MSVTVDVVELQVAIPGARAIEIDRHAFEFEVVPMFSGEDPTTWKYFDAPVSGNLLSGRNMPYYMFKHGVAQMRPHEQGGVWAYPPEATSHVRKDIERVVTRNRKVGLTTNVNQTGATLTSVAVVISTTGVRTCSPNLRSREEVNCIQTVSVSDLIQQGGRAARVAPGRQYIMASELRKSRFSVSFVVQAHLSCSMRILHRWSAFAKRWGWRSRTSRL